MKRLSIALSLVVVLLGMFGTSLFFVQARISPASVTQSDNAKIPFIENVGQFGAGARFRTQTEYGTLFLANNALWLTVLEEGAASSDAVMVTEEGRERPVARGGVNLRLSFVRANPHPTIEAFDPLTTSINYFYGNDPTKWHTHVPVWGGVRYKDLYPGIDLELTSVAGVTAQRFVVQDERRADLTQVALQIEGGQALALTPDGIAVATGFGTYRLPLFEVVGSSSVRGYPGVRDNVVTAPFVGDISPLAALPPSGLLPSSLLYATYLGGNDYDIAHTVAVDKSGSIYVGGYTESLDFPTTPGVFDPFPTPSDYAREAFITKFSTDGTDLAYSTYIHGNNSDYIYALAIDSLGQVFATGQTRSSNFPTTPNAPTPGFGGEVDAFVLKLSADGSSLLYSFYLGGEDIDTAEDIEIMNNGTAVVGGTSTSITFPTTAGAYDTENPTASTEAFVTKVASDGSTLLFSTFLGGAFRDEGLGVAVDREGAAYITGITESKDFPTTPNAYDTTPAAPDYFVTKLTPDGSALVYSTYVDGYGQLLSGTDIAVDTHGAAYVTSNTYAPTFPATAGAYDTECGQDGVGCGEPQNAGDGVLFKLDPTGSEMVYGTYLGGSGNDYGRKVRVDDYGNAYVIGGMQSPENRVTPGGYLPPHDYGVAVWKISADGSHLLHLSRIPGGAGRALDLQLPDVIVYAGGVVDYAYYETTEGAYDRTPNGDRDAGTGRLALPAASTSITLTLSSGTLTSVVDGTEYTLAPNTFTDTVVLTHAPRHRLSLPPIAPRVAVGHTFVNYAIAPDGTTALQPTQRYHLTIAYDPATLGATEASLRLYYWNGSAWEIEPTMQLFTDQNIITADPDRLGWWIVSAEPHYYHLPIIRH